LRDQDFRTVFVVTRAQGSRDVFARDQTETETVARRFVLGSVGLEIIPEMIGERVFVRDFGVEDGFELWPFRRKFRELERAPFAKADEENALAMLRHDAPRIYDAVSSAVARPSALASLATFLIPGLRRPRSIPLM